MKKVVALGALVLSVGALAACGSTSTTPQGVDTEPSLEQLIADNPTTPHFCELYNSLVDQGWNNETIYSEVKAGGGFDSYPLGTGKTVYDALVKWCYQNYVTVNP